MPDYVAFLRAINLGKNRKFPMAELRSCLEADGFTDVETYIASGNVRLRTSLRSTARVTARLEQVFAADRGFEVSTVVLTPAELSQVAADADGLIDPGLGEARRYVTLLRDEPSSEAVQRVEALTADGEAARLLGRAVHVWVRDGYRNATFDNARLERLLGPATTRNLDVVRTLAERWGS